MSGEPSPKQLQVWLRKAFVPLQPSLQDSLQKCQEFVPPLSSLLSEAQSTRLAKAGVQIVQDRLHVCPRAAVRACMAAHGAPAWQGPSPPPPHLHALSGNLLRQEYTLAHLEPPDSLEAAEAGIRKFEDFLVSMENNRDKVLSPVDSGNKLVAEGNLYSDKIKEKVQLIEDRYSLPRGSGGRSQVG